MKGGTALKINVTVRHFDLTPGMREHVVEKVEKLGRFFDRIHLIDVVAWEEGERHTIEVKVHVGKGTTLVGKVEEPDLYTALDLVIDKLERQLRKFKEKLVQRKTRPHLPESGVPVDEGEDEVEETYEDAVRNMTSEDA
jgi:putative sigma-54 modulation protein